MTRPAPMRRFAAILFLLGFLFIGGKSVRAQYYSWGADAAALRWKHLRTEDVRVVFPDTASALAHRTLYYIQAVRPTITHGFSHPPLKIPFVLHTENFQSNGLVMWMPKRIEFLTTPSVDSYSMPWVKQLVAHEYRHAVQYNNLNRGLIRILSYLIGQQGSTVGLLFMPLWALEGDAVMNETEMSSYGRGRQPRFTIEYRALGYEVLRRRNCDKWFCGSFRDFVPDHYQMGYQMVAYGYDRYGDGIWDKTLRYGVRNAYMLTFSTSVALRKFYGTGEGILFRDAFADLNRFWDSLPKVTDSGRTLTPLPEKNYTTYTHPVSLNDTTLVALKTDFDRPSRLVAVDSRTGRERRRTWTGLVSSRPTTDGQRVWWTEYRRSLLFPERVNSRLVVLAPGKKTPPQRTETAQCPLPDPDRAKRRPGLGGIYARRTLHDRRRRFTAAAHRLAHAGLLRSARTGLGQCDRTALHARHRQFGHVDRPDRTRRGLAGCHPRRLHHAERPAGRRRQALLRLDRLGPR